MTGLENKYSNDYRRKPINAQYENYLNNLCNLQVIEFPIYYFY